MSLKVLYKCGVKNGYDSSDLKYLMLLTNMQLYGEIVCFQLLKIVYLAKSFNSKLFLFIS